MNLNLSNANQRGILVAVSFLIAILLSYFSIRNARAIHFASLQTPAECERNTQLLQVCLVRLPSDQPEDKIQGTAWIEDVALVPAFAERPKP